MQDLIQLYLYPGDQHARRQGQGQRHLIHSHAPALQADPARAQQPGLLGGPAKSRRPERLLGLGKDHRPRHQRARAGDPRRDQRDFCASCIGEEEVVHLTSPVIPESL